MQPPLTGARKNNVSEKQATTKHKNQVTVIEKCSDPTFMIKLDNDHLVSFTGG